MPAAGAISLGMFWRVTLVLPPFVCLLLVALYSLISAAFFWSPEPYTILEITWQRVTTIAVGGITIGIWPGYMFWAGVYLWVTRSLSAGRFRAMSWMAPLTFAPFAIVAFLVANAFRADPAQTRLEGFLILFGLALLLGYVSIGVAMIFEWLFRRLGWLKRSAQGLPDRAAA